MRSIFKEVFVFFYFHAIKMKPKNSKESNMLAASVMTGLIGAPVGFNLSFILYKIGPLAGVSSEKLWLVIFMIIAPFVIYFYRKGKVYLKEIEEEPEYKPRFKIVVYCFIFCFFTAGLSTLFF